MHFLSAYYTFHHTTVADIIPHCICLSPNSDTVSPFRILQTAFYVAVLSDFDGSDTNTALISFTIAVLGSQFGGNAGSGLDVEAGGKCLGWRRCQCRRKMLRQAGMSMQAEKCGAGRDVNAGGKMRGRGDLWGWWNL